MTLCAKSQQKQDLLPKIIEGQKLIDQMGFDAYSVKCLNDHSEYTKCWKVKGDVCLSEIKKSLYDNHYSVCSLAYVDSDLGFDVYPDEYVKVVKLSTGTKRNGNRMEELKEFKKRVKQKTHPRRRANGPKRELDFEPLSDKQAGFKLFQNMRPEEKVKSLRANPLNYAPKMDPKKKKVWKKSPEYKRMLVMYGVLPNPNQPNVMAQYAAAIPTF